MLGVKLRHKYPAKLAKKVTDFKDRVETDSGSFLHRFGVRDPLKFSEDASLVITPNAIKAGKLYSVIPSNGTGDGTVSRATKATRVNKEGLIELVDPNIPRVTWEDGFPVVLCEPQRTNKIVHSNSFSESYWNNVRCSKISHDNPSPNVENNATLIEEDLFNSSSSIIVSGTNLSLNGFETFYISICPVNNCRYIGLSFGSPFNRVRTTFDFENESFLDPYYNGDCQNAIFSYKKQKNGFIKLIITVEFTTATTGRVEFSALASFNYIAFETYNSSNRSFLVSNAQVTEGFFSVSEIPTTLSAVTKNRDELTGFGDVSTFNSEEFTFFIECKPFSISADNRRISISLNSSTRFIFTIKAAGGVNIAAIIGGIVEFSIDLTGTVDIDSYYKYAIRVKENDVQIYKNGSPDGSTSSYTAPPSGTFDRLNFATSGGTALFFEGKIKSIAVYNRGLTDQELEILTS